MANKNKGALRKTRGVRRDRDRKIQKSALAKASRGGGVTSRRARFSER